MTQLEDRTDIAAIVNAWVTDESTICDATGRSLATVHRVMKRIRYGSSLKHAAVLGKPKVLSERNRGIIAQSLRHDPTLSASQIVEILGQNGKLVSLWTVKDTIKDMGYACKRPPRGQMISGDYKIRRGQFAEQHFNEEVDWTKVVFADESQVTAP